MNIKYENVYKTYDYIHICVLGNTLFLNVIKNNKIKLTYRFDIMELIFNEKEKSFLPTLLSHWKYEDILISINDLKYLKLNKIL